MEGNLMREKFQEKGWTNHEGNWTNTSWQLLICEDVFLQVPEGIVILLPPWTWRHLCLPSVHLCGTGVARQQ